jgi:hypothetical protein
LPFFGDEVLPKAPEVMKRETMRLTGATKIAVSLSLKKTISGQAGSPFAKQGITPRA